MLTFHKTIITINTLLCLLSSTLLYGEASHPNVIFMLVDDLGFMDLGVNGSAFYESPHIDQLAKEGMNFKRANMAAPRCVSSRVALMTGRYPYRNKLKDRNGITRKTKLISEVFKEEGYRTFFAGKWHLGHKESEYPDGRGFDINIGGCDAGSPHSYWFPYLKKEQRLPGLEEGSSGEYLTDRLTHETEDFIREHHSENPERPFFVMLSHYGVHTPLEGKLEKVKKYEAKRQHLNTPQGETEFFKDHTGQVKRKQDHPVYAAMIESIDESVGQLRQVLAELGLDKNTIIIFSSDHGGLSTTEQGGQREIATSNLPLRTGKGWLYEGGLRVPLIVFDPVHKAKGQSTAVINGTDLFPTMLELSDLDLRPSCHLDGHSFARILIGQNYERPEPVIWHYMFAKKGTGNTAMSVVLDDPYKLVWLEVEQKFELYHLGNDPGEQDDLSERQPEVLKRLETLRQAKLKELKVRPLKKDHNFFKTSVKLLKQAGLEAPAY